MYYTALAHIFDQATNIELEVCATMGILSTVPRLTHKQGETVALGWGGTSTST